MTCARCGATVLDRMRHLAWHARNDDPDNRLAEPTGTRGAAETTAPRTRTAEAALSTTALAPEHERGHDEP
ncbi:hypothetical protein KRR39_09340 [Nocardioides panacis]|uniref:Uncharacterized protein n=1 Tax=Nocardioides panacis TaxID=2849501 RepID=A0A975Y1V4_9ACTN|nr:hypothetical protein [Nocardioides panacis]QWZ09906.1 hypothetical protein KRR39_09340 [Nocardioides panacis]